jgi:hypothetical protein
MITRLVGRKGLNTETSGTDKAIISQGGRCQAIYAWLRLFPSVCGKRETDSLTVFPFGERVAKDLKATNNIKKTYYK